MLKRSLLLLMLLALTGAAQAEESIQSVRDRIDAFNRSPDHILAPLSIANASSNLSDAAASGDDREKRQKLLHSAMISLAAAQETARQFKATYPKLLDLKESTRQTAKRIDPERLQPVQGEVLDWINRGDALVTTTIEDFEKGILGESRQAAENARVTYYKAVNLMLPILGDEVGSILYRSSFSGASTYTPKTFNAAKRELSEAEKYMQGEQPDPPARPYYSLTLAERSRDLSGQIRELRKDPGSHEALILWAQQDRLDIGHALGIESDPGDASADIKKEAILEAIAKLRQQIDREKEARQADRQSLKAQYEAKIEAKTSSLLTERNEQLNRIQEAFRAKLERETFENKRQKQLRDLFGAKEVDILVNLDGSLLIRLTGLVFASGSSKLPKSAASLLEKLHQGLEVYGERKVVIEGHTDDVGDVKINQRLSLKRAEAVRDFLIRAKTDAGRLKALGYGEVRPIASNEFEKGRAMNRRIDVVIEAQHD